jgi:hypothetical protein
MDAGTGPHRRDTDMDRFVLAGDQAEPSWRTDTLMKNALGQFQKDFNLIIYAAIERV